MSLFRVLVIVCCLLLDLVRSRGVSGRGEVITCVTGVGLSHTIKVSLLTTLARAVGSSPVYVSMRDGGRANSQFDFLLFIIDCIQDGQLVQGDVLVLDNASIHTAQHIIVPLTTVLRAAGVTMWRLPTYSPELNPCEFVFAQCKKWLRYHRRMQNPFWYEIARGMAETTPQHMLNCYNKSIWNP